MNKMIGKVVVGAIVVLLGVYVLYPTKNAEAKPKNSAPIVNKYVTLESKPQKTQSNQPGVTITVSQEAASSGVVKNFKQALINKYSGDGSVQIYISQASGVLGGPEQVNYDVTINGNLTTGLIAKRNVTLQGFTTTKTMSAVQFS